MRRLHALLHVEAEGPGRIGEVATAIGLEVVLHHLFRGDPVPSALPDGDLLVLMGGPMGVADLDDPSSPFLSSEVHLLQSLLADARPVLGICLGAQLVAHAAGGRVFPMGLREAGWGRVDRVREDPVLDGLPARFMALHWHQDTFELPSGARLLASTPTCQNQMFRIGPRCFGVQFHVETTVDQISTWVREDVDLMGSSTGAAILDDTARLYPSHLQLGNRLIENLLRAMMA